MTRKKKTDLKDVELRLIAELMKNCHRSDRELARAIRTSQPTVSRIRTRLEKEGIIREYAMIPDFVKLGYQIMGVSFAKATHPEMDGSSTETRKAVVETEHKHPNANLIAVKGIGLGKDTSFISFYKDYAECMRSLERASQIPHVALGNMENFLVDLNDKNNYRILTMAQIARHIVSSEQSAEP